MRRSVIVVVVSFATSIFGIEPGELVRLYRAGLTNSEAMMEVRKVLDTLTPDALNEIASRMNGFELLLMCPAVESVSATSENLTITFRGANSFVTHNGVWRRVAEYVENNEALVLTPGQEASLTRGFHGHVHLTPVSFKNKRQGFKVLDSDFDGNDERRCVAYIALSDKPTEVSEDDVDMVMEKGEWKKFVKEGGAQVSSPSRNKAKKEKAIADDGQDEGRATASPPSRLWLYALIPLALAVLWLAHRKRKHGTKN